MSNRTNSNSPTTFIADARDIVARLIEETDDVVVCSSLSEADQFARRLRVGARLRDTHDGIRFAQERAEREARAADPLGVRRVY